MTKIHLILVFSLTISSLAKNSEPLSFKTESLQSLAQLVTQKKPWTTVEANSEQRQPYYIGASPREFVIHGKKEKRPRLPRFTKHLLESQAQIILQNLNLSAAQFEVWPYLTDLGDPNWVFARYRKSPEGQWFWLDKSCWKLKKTTVPEPALPWIMNPHSENDAHLLFSDFLNFEVLYQKPLFQEAIWTKERAKTIIHAWIAKTELSSLKQSLSKDPTVRARVLPQPARFNEQPVSFIVQASKDSHLNWGSQFIDWYDNPSIISKQLASAASLTFKPDFTERFLEDIKILTGESNAVFPISKKTENFARKGAFQPDNQLLAIVSYLEERYHSLGLKTFRQNFTWRGIPQANLVAIIPGKDRTLPPILFADHFDTAVAEDLYSKTHERITNPGADDNTTATASLLRAAVELTDKTPKRDIWILHLTGEEFPTDDLGARYFFRHLLKTKKDIAGMILVDMIGIREKNDPVYQINSGKTQQSIEVSQLAMEVAKSLPSPFVPTFRERFSDESYLYNTDGYIADSLGFPVVFFNEHLNRRTIEKINHHYHQSTDTSSNLDLEYATHISKVAITTLWNAALK